MTTDTQRPTRIKNTLALHMPPETLECRVNANWPVTPHEAYQIDKNAAKIAPHNQPLQHLLRRMANTIQCFNERVTDYERANR